MNELAKLLSSVLLLGAGFCAASLVGPPEAVMRLAHYLQPSGAPTADGLRPLPADAPPVDFAGWPALPPSSETPAAAAPAAEPTNVAQVAAMLPPSSWEPSSWQETSAVAPSAFEPSASPWAAAPGLADAEAPPTGDWLTGANVAEPAPALEAPAERPLTPVPRGGEAAEVAAAPATVAKAAEPTFNEPTWPELRAPLPPFAEREAVTYAKPASSDAPYAVRPRFADEGVLGGANPLRSDAPLSDGMASDGIASDGMAPLARTAAAERYHQHVITDGDTLPLLAERYLGDAARAQELFELNRDRLEHPDLLPIGMVLRAPEKPARSAAPAEPTSALTSPPASPYATGPYNPGFATVSATSPTAPSFAETGSVAVRPLAPIGTAEDRPLTAAQQAGPIDPLYDAEATWDANRW